MNKRPPTCCGPDCRGRGCTAENVTPPSTFIAPARRIFGGSSCQTSQHVASTSFPLFGLAGNRCGASAFVMRCGGYVARTERRKQGHTVCAALCGSGILPRGAGRKGRSYLIAGHMNVHELNKDACTHSRCVSRPRYVCTYTVPVLVEYFFRV